MVVDERIRLHFPRILSFVVIGAAVGAGYGYETSIAAAAGLRGLIRGALTGVLIGAAAESLADRLLRNPITGVAGCCARASSGHTAAPPRSEMKSRQHK
jgi:hypothetical protein